MVVKLEALNVPDPLCVTVTFVALPPKVPLSDKISLTQVLDEVVASEIVGGFRQPQFRFTEV